MFWMDSVLLLLSVSYVYYLVVALLYWLLVGALQTLSCTDDEEEVSLHFWADKDNDTDITSVESTSNI